MSSGTSIRLSNILVDRNTLNITNTNNSTNLIVSSNTTLSGSPNILQLDTTTTSSSNFNFISTKANSIDILTINGLGNVTTSGVITTTNNTNSTSTSTGALIVTGGIGSGGNLNIGGTGTIIGNVLIGSSGVTPSSELHLHKNSSTTVSLRITDSTTGTGVTDGISFFKDTSSHLNLWNYENAQILLGTNNLTRLRIDSTGEVNILSTSNSTNVSTGCLRLSGGLGVSGNIYYSGTLQGISDISVKDITEYIKDNQIDKIKKINCIKYTRKDILKKDLEIGLIAQEIHEIYPEIAKKDENGIYTIDYSRLVVILICCIKELDFKLNRLNF